MASCTVTLGFFAIQLLLTTRISCVYSVTLETSFQEVHSFYDQVLRVKDVEKIPFVLVGNKCDLETDRQVSKEEGEKLARELECKFFEVRPWRGSQSSTPLLTPSTDFSQAED